MYRFYHILTAHSGSALAFLLSRRLAKGKEDPLRWQEKQGQTERIRSEGFLFWVHAASVGEVQSTLVLIRKLLDLTPQAHILVTTGTLNSARIIEPKLPARCFHQFYPLDHPAWTARFLDHWRADFVIWMESELWPNMLMQIKDRRIPAILVNARLSPRSFARWRKLQSLAKTMLSTFSKILCQTQKDADYYAQLGVQKPIVTGNLKFSGAPLPFDKSDLQALSVQTSGRPLWLFASTHDGEEQLAGRIHASLKPSIPDLLTIVVPRHPERRNQIAENLKNTGLSITFRGSDKIPPQENTDLYIADTLGELGLFYRLAPLAVIGRSFSDDGGGGHNPIEAAQLSCAVLHGPNIQNLQDIYDMMDSEGAALRMTDQTHLEYTLRMFLTDQSKREELQKKSLAFSRTHHDVAEIVMKEIMEVVNAHAA